MTDFAMFKYTSKARPSKVGRFPFSIELIKSAEIYLEVGVRFTWKQLALIALPASFLQMTFDKRRQRYSSVRTHLYTFEYDGTIL